MGTAVSERAEMLKQCAWCGALRAAEGHGAPGLALAVEVEVTFADGSRQSYRVSHGLCEACKERVLGGGR